MNAEARALRAARDQDEACPRNPQVRVIWNPQGFGSPNVPGNMPAAYWPGKDFVDVVGNDLYDISGQRDVGRRAQASTKQHPEKPYAFPEWGLWGIDDPGFIRQACAAGWTDASRESSSWPGTTARRGSIWDLALEAGEPQGLPALHHTARSLETAPTRERLR